MNVLQICAVVCSFISLLMHLISLGSDFWVITGTIHAGLWKSCVGSTCSIVQIAGDVRVFMLLGMMAGAVSFFGLCASFCVLKLGSLFLTRISATASFLAAVCVLIAMAIYTETFSSLHNSLPGSPMSFGWSFGLGWASFPLFLLTGVLAQLIKNDA